VDGSSVDSSRIVRADYSDPVYSLLCAEAQRIWRGDAPGNVLNDIGKEGRYTQSGLVLTEDKHTSAEAGYVRKAYDTVVRIGWDSVRLLPTREEVEDICSGGGRSGTGGNYGERGYVNYSSGWADAQESLSFVRRVLERTGRVSFRVAEVARLLESSSSSHDCVVVGGAVLKSGEVIRADLTVLATGAWTPGLLDMSGRAVATGQALAYLRLSEEEWEAVRNMPVVLNITRGILIIPHHKRELKIARHASGYLNPVTTEEGNTFSSPRTAVTHPGTEIPQEAQQMFCQELWEMMPRFKGRQWESTRLCWYTDTCAFPQPGM
jgi:sarcosine oxidase/L-pipecolate oxidase